MCDVWFIGVGVFFFLLKVVLILEEFFIFMLIFGICVFLWSDKGDSGGVFKF